jgi:hypothetical protein
MTLASVMIKAETLITAMVRLVSRNLANSGVRCAVRGRVNASEHGSRAGTVIAAIALLLTTACSQTPSPEDTINLKLYQDWQLQPGDVINGFAIVAGLGDISVALNGKSVYAPFTGRAQKDQQSCLIFSSPDVPAYLFRLCGVANLHLGACNQGDVLGNAATLHFATLRKQPNGTWAIVEPSKPILERILTKT